MMLGYNHDVHAVGFLQWGIKQQGQPGDSFMKGLGRWARLLFSPIVTMGVVGSMSVWSNHKYFLHKQKSSEINMQHSPTGASLVGSTLHARKDRQRFFFFFPAHIPAVPAHRPLGITSLLRQTPPPPTATLLLERQVFI